MKETFIFLAVATLGCVIYHIGQKAIPSTTNPMVVLMVVYFVAFLLAMTAVPFFRNSTQINSSTQIFSWPVLVVGIGVILIEGGFLLAYRSGGSLQWSGVVVNAIAAIVLVPIAICVFRESFSTVRVIGIILTLSGMALITQK